MSIGTMTIRDREFALTSAELMGYVTSVGEQITCKWHVDIKGEERAFLSDDSDDPDDSEFWEPYAYVHHLRSDVRSWRDFEGAVFSGEDEQGPELSVVRDDTAFRLYVYEHAPIARNRLVFSNRDGHCFDLVWTGEAAVYAGEEYWENIPFSIQAKVQVTRVAMLLSAEELNAPAPPITEIFSSVLDPATFRQLPTREGVDLSGHQTWETDFVPA